MLQVADRGATLAKTIKYHIWGRKSSALYFKRLVKVSGSYRFTRMRTRMCGGNLALTALLDQLKGWCRINTPTLSIASEKPLFFIAERHKRWAIKYIQEHNKKELGDIGKIYKSKELAYADTQKQPTALFT